MEISSDAVAHTQVIAGGTPTDKLLDPHTQQGSQESSPGQAQHKAVSVAPLSNGSGNFTTTWYDPIGIRVNWVKDTINFSYNGRDVTGFSGYDNRWWLSNDGWFEASHYIGSGYTRKDNTMNMYRRFESISGLAAAVLGILALAYALFGQIYRGIGSSGQSGTASLLQVGIQPITIAVLAVLLLALIGLVVSSALHSSTGETGWQVNTWHICSSNCPGYTSYAP